VAGSIEPVSDATLANHLLEKTNQMNRDTGRDALVFTALWSILPQETASSLIFVGWLVTILYFLQDKVPTENDNA